MEDLRVPPSENTVSYAHARYKATSYINRSAFSEEKKRKADQVNTNVSLQQIYAHMDPPISNALSSQTKVKYMYFLRSLMLFLFDHESIRLRPDVFARLSAAHQREDADNIESISVTYAWRHWQ
jgi:hypothetical protein